MKMTVKQLILAIFASCAWFGACVVGTVLVTRALGADGTGQFFASLLGICIGGGSLTGAWCLIPDALEHEERLRLAEQKERDRLWEEAQKGMK